MSLINYAKRCILIFIILFFTIPSFSQDELRDNSPDITGFRNWLSRSWLNPYLLFDTIEIESKKINLTLVLNCNHDCSEQWNHICLSFDSLSNLTFEEYLHNKASFLLDVSRYSLVLEIYNKTTPFESPCFYRRIVYNDSLIISTANCKDLKSNSSLEYAKLNPIFSINKLKIPFIDEKANTILDFLYSKSEYYYKLKGKNVTVNKISSTNSSITFEVRNLNNEVIPKSPLLAFKTIEVLRFTILCTMHSSAVQFETSINGKLGSNLIRPISDKGYNDMEDDHKVELQNYINVFTNNTILNWLRK